MKPICLTIAGSDSGGGAGIQADLKSFFDLGCYGVSILTAVTAQNTQSVLALEAISDHLFEKELEAIESDLLPKAIKTGMLASVKQVELVAKFLSRYPEMFYVCDPVMIATSGDRLVDQEVVDAIKLKLFPKADLITPNFDEAKALLADCNINCPRTLAIELKNKYLSKAVLVKGGHLNNNQAQDYYQSDQLSYNLVTDRIEKDAFIHGTGCTLSAAVVSFLAQSYDLDNALTLAKAYITEGITNARPISMTNLRGLSAIPVSHGGFPQDRRYFPKIDFYHLSDHLNGFLKLKEPIGFYPIVDSSDWVLYLAKLGIKTIQLRIKNKPLGQTEKEIKQSVEIQKKYQLQLFINDYWKLAIKHQAFGIHLGHEDLYALSNDEIQFMQNNHIRLGLSTHDYFELAFALNVKPSYVALGPIYPTTTKQMRFAPQGIEKINRWKSLIDIPLVAIGGINLDNIQKVIDCGVDGIAVISLITKAKDPKNIITKVNRLFQPLNEAVISE